MFTLIEILIFSNMFIILLIIFIRKQKLHHSMTFSRFEKIIAIWMAILTTITTVSVIYPILSKQSPNTIANEIIERNGDNEIYELKIYNLGGIAHNLRIEIEFPTNTTYIQLEYLGNPLIKTHEDIDANRHYYYVIYSSIQENELVGVRFIVQNGDMKNNDSLIIKPDVWIWTDEDGKVDIQE